MINAQPEVIGLAFQVEVAAIAEDLHVLAARLDRAGSVVDVGDGLAAMSLDTASQAVHLALVELEDCIVAA